jgi:hypothetical protein
MKYILTIIVLLRFGCVMAGESLQLERLGDGGVTPWYGEYVETFEDEEPQSSVFVTSVLPEMLPSPYSEADLEWSVAIKKDGESFEDYQMEDVAEDGQFPSLSFPINHNDSGVYDIEVDVLIRMRNSSGVSRTVNLSASGQLIVLAPDLDVDSDNNSNDIDVGYPNEAKFDRSLEEDRIEADVGEVGFEHKYTQPVPVRGFDTNGNAIPDKFDGIDVLDNANMDSQNGFVVGILDVSNVPNFLDYYIKIDYTGSDPTLISRDLIEGGHGSPIYFFDLPDPELERNALRIWSADAGVVRNPLSINSGGHYFVPGEYYAVSQLGDLIFGQREIYMEGVSYEQSLYLDVTVTVSKKIGETYYDLISDIVKIRMFIHGSESTLEVSP